MKFITDDSHGWLAVSTYDYPHAKNFGTGYGYIDEENSVIYLETDCEAWEFLRAEGKWEDAKNFPVTNIDGQAFVRKFKHNEAVFSYNF